MTADNNQQRAMATASRGTQVFFQQGCPVCGRRLEIDVNLLGRRVYCQHCGGGFIATDTCVGISSPREENRPQSAIVDELIERAAVMLGLTPDQDGQ